MKKILFAIFMFVSILANAQVEVIPTMGKIFEYKDEMVKGVVLKIGDYVSDFIPSEVLTYDGETYSNGKPKFDLTPAHFTINDDREALLFAAFVTKNSKELMKKYGIYISCLWSSSVKFCYQEDWEAYQADLQEWKSKSNKEILDRYNSLSGLL